MSMNAGASNRGRCVVHLAGARDVGAHHLVTSLGVRPVSLPHVTSGVTGTPQPKIAAWSPVQSSCLRRRGSYLASARAGQALTHRHNLSANTDALRRPRAARAPGASRRLPTR
jgi:hypothetical protein